MPNSQLAERFLAKWTDPSAPQSSLRTDRQALTNQLIEIGHYQIEVQKAAAHFISQSQIAAAETIGLEIRQQTEALEASLQEFSSQISSDLDDMTHQLTFAIEQLGGKICAHLGEIKWHLAQQRDTLGNILRTLRENRSNEARQLVEQGVRHYLNQQYDRAEEKFRSALAQDSTDFQVLMNLGLISVRKGLADEALQFFKDALRLPASLDNFSKNQVLLNIARVYYALGRNHEAFATAQRAAALAESRIASEIFTLGTYAALAGHCDHCLPLVWEAIQLDSAFFSRAAADPDLETCRPAVLEMLGRRALEERQTVTKKLLSFTTSLGHLNLTAIAVCVDELELLNTVGADIQGSLAASSYSDLIRFDKAIVNFSSTLKPLAAAEKIARERDSNQKLRRELSEAASVADRELAAFRLRPSPYRLRFWFLWHVATWLPLAFFIEVTGLGAAPLHLPLLNLPTVAAWWAAWAFVGMAVWWGAQQLSHAYAVGFELEQREEIDKKSKAARDASNSLSSLIAQVVTQEKKIGEFVDRVRLALAAGKRTLEARESEALKDQSSFSSVAGDISDNQIISLAKAGEIADAIRLYRKKYSAGLAQATAGVESLLMNL